MPAHLNIAALAKRTGVAPDTLRKWERRYGVLRPLRTAGGQRRYTQRDAARVEWLRDRLAEGWRIGEAAGALRASDVTAPADPQALTEELIRVAAAGDTPALGALLDQAFAVLPVERALQEVVVPLMRWVGDAWSEGALSVAEEHAVTARVRPRLEQLVADDRGPVRGTAVLACAPGEQHDLGLLMLAVGLRADGWAAEFLGQSTPVADTLDLARSLGARVVCFSSSRAASFEELRRGLDRMRGDHPRIVAGGPGIDFAASSSHATWARASTLCAAVAEIDSVAS